MVSVFIALALQVGLSGALPLQEGQEGAKKTHPSEFGPPKSVMSDIKIKIKAVGRYSYEATVYVEGTPIEFVSKAPLVPDSFSISRPLGLRYVLARRDSDARYVPSIPFWMDNRYIMSGPNKVQASPVPLGWGF
jgi:hypothetical protein